MSLKQKIFTVQIDKLIHGGQGLGTLEDGKKALVWGALPREKVTFLATKSRKDYVEGVTQEIIESSKERVVPRDHESYLSTSPWQILSEKSEDAYKQIIVEETFAREGVQIRNKIITHPTDNFYGYRNKMEYSFYGDENGLHLALYDRGTHQKRIVSGSSIAMESIDQAAKKILKILNEKSIRAGDLKTLMLRCDQTGKTVAALFVKDENFPRLKELDGICEGMAVVFSNPKSPASVRTKDIYSFGTLQLSDNLNGNNVAYDVFSFFQVNVPVFSKTLSAIVAMTMNEKVVDLYSGVGSIGLSLPSTTTLIESDTSNSEWAKHNAEAKSNIAVIHAPSEQALEYIESDKVVVVDPPRSGLHRKLVDRLVEQKVPKLIYLSCNPVTQARDIKLLSGEYELEELHCYNFFPRTPHIETLACLVRR